MDTEQFKALLDQAGDPKRAVFELIIQCLPKDATLSKGEMYDLWNAFVFRLRDDGVLDEKTAGNFITYHPVDRLYPVFFDVAA